MLFNSNFFIYVFLPLLIILVFLLRNKLRIMNYCVLLLSLVFYYCIASRCIFVLVAVVLFNYFLGILIAKDCSVKEKRLLLTLAVLGDIGTLVFYKYAEFFFKSILDFTGTDYGNTIINNIVLPVGISFFTFQALSYVIDVYRGTVTVQKNFIKFSLYITLFPQLVAGPIVRYKDICDEIDRRKIVLNDVWDGSFRFILGLSKKVLIADVLSTPVNEIWKLGAGNISTSLAWIAALLYTLQIYYDFSGYSDMAIGLGKMMGFHFPENFMRPYTAENMRDFWRRWHISLSSFLRDYLYIPLGGNRKGEIRTYVNLTMVFLVCGLWHGAGWNYIIWGLYHGLFLIIERILDGKKIMLIRSKSVGRVLTFLLVTIGWVMFRAPSVNDAFVYYKAMFGLSHVTSFQYFTFGHYVPVKIIVISLVALLGSVFVIKRPKFAKANCYYALFMIFGLLLCMATLSGASFNPFIYFQF